MRHMIKSTLALILIAGLSGCKDFLDKYPKTSVTEVTAFTTYDNFKTYAWGFYDNFDGFPTDGGYEPTFTNIESYTDNMIYANTSKESPYAYQTKSHPSTSSKWDFSYIRRVNIMLRNIEGSEMDQKGKDHWTSVGYFFRAWRYFSLIADYGEIPWLPDVVADDDDAIIFGPRTSRTTVAKNILDDLLWAEQHIIPAGDGSNTINRDVVRALLSRFCLFEGTWQKYHGIGDGSAYLDECIRVSAELVKNNPNLQARYEDAYVSTALVGKPGILLCKQYAQNKTTHSIGRVIRTSAWYYDLTKDAVDSYLCTDGKPVSTSTVYDGDKTMYDQFRNRDRRLYYTVIPPHKVGGVSGASSQTWNFLEGEANKVHREYIDLMTTLSPADGKRLPVSNFAGNYTGVAPHFRKYNQGQGFICTELGFYFWKYYNTHQTNQGLRSDTENYPLFMMSEVMLNYAEAAFERGKLTQEIVDATINKLRVRAGISAMQLSEITAAFDPARDQTVDPVLWEIRRERRVELMGDGFRFNDLKRWKKGHYVNKKPLGVWIKKSDIGANMLIDGGGSEGYVYYFDTPKGWLDKYYLEPVPSLQTELNPNLLPNNPGWD